MCVFGGALPLFYVSPRCFWLTPLWWWFSTLEAYIAVSLCVIWCSKAICGNKMPTRCNRGFYCRSYCLLNMFRAPLCPSSGAQEYYTVVAAFGIWCCGFQVVGLVWSWGFKSNLEFLSLLLFVLGTIGGCTAPNYLTEHVNKVALLIVNFFLQENIRVLASARHNIDSQCSVVWIHKQQAGGSGKKSQVGLHEVAMTTAWLPRSRCRWWRPSA